MPKVLFYPKSELIKQVIPPPQPVEVPDWFKKIPLHYNDENTLEVTRGVPNYTVKTCIPFLDTFTTGYTFNLWCDVQIKTVKEGPSVTWSSLEESFSPMEFAERPSFIPVQEGFLSFNFSWISHWGIQTPKGYSTLFTHPLTRTDLPFVTSSGIMDTDGWGIWGNQPFAIKRDFEGVIPAGTPIIQAIPFKRENWKSGIDESLTEWAVAENLRRESKFRGYYKKKYWNKKSFE